MIAKLTGRRDSSTAGHAVIDVGGVGYLVEASARTLDALGPVGGDVTIPTEMLVRADFLRLLGFAKAEESDWFRLLPSLQGVGARGPLQILSAPQIRQLQRALAALCPVGGDVTIHTEMLVGEDFLRLLGFAKAEERDWFRLLTSVQGVGAKVALAILSALEIGDLQRALASGDSAMIARANGVGPKLAQRITHELKDKAGALGGIAGSAPALAVTPGPLADAVTALTGLGFKPGEAKIGRAHV